MGAFITNIDIDDLVRKYNSGRSVKSLAEEFGVSRGVIVHRLHSVGVTQRNRSESMFLRMSQTPTEERKRLAKAAQDARRRNGNSPEMLHKLAIAKKRFIGIFEAEFINAITSAGIDVIPQEPFLSYNLDIGCGDIAVEIHTQIASPLSSRYIQRLMQCVKAGKNMIYVWISPRRLVVSDACYKNVISLIQSIRMNPPTRSKYWVIRGTGELYATGSFDSD